MKKLIIIFIAALAAAAHAEEQYLGLYLQGNKIGYSSYNSHPELLGQKTVTRSDSRTFMGAGLLGGTMKITMDSTTWSDENGRPIKMFFLMSSQGRTQRLTASFGAATAEVDVENGGQRTHKSLPIPKGALIVDDPLSLMVGGGMAAGARKVIYILDPATVTFMKNEILVVGPAEAKFKDKTVAATLVRIVDPRYSTDVFVNGKGDIVKVQALMGIEMVPEPREIAMADGGGEYKPAADLAFATSLHPDKEISDPASLTGMKLRLSGHDLSQLPSDEHQTIKRQGDRWIVDVHPPKISNEKPTSIASAAKSAAVWTKPSLYVPSGSKAFRDLAKTIVHGEKRVLPAALAIKDYVNKTMRPNAGIGVLRDATEVLATKEGVCRDYAILTATLCRAAGIPARLASGVVNFQGDFYYHAWVEVWDGSKWIGIDSTVLQRQISAAHVKLAMGNVEEAFAFTFLDKVKIEVLDLRRR